MNERRDALRRALLAAWDATDSEAVATVTRGIDGAGQERDPVFFTAAVPEIDVSVTAVIWPDGTADITSSAGTSEKTNISGTADFEILCQRMADILADR